MSSFDFSVAAVQDVVFTLEIKHPVTGEKIAEMDVVSIDSERPTAVRRTQEKRRVQSRKPYSSEQIESDLQDQLAACIVAWRGVQWQGAELLCTSENVKMLFSKIPWLADDVARSVNDPGFFLSNSPKSSKPSAAPTST